MSFGKTGATDHDGKFCTVQIELITDETESNPFMRDQYKTIVDAREHNWDVYIRVGKKKAPQGAPMYRALDDEEGRERCRIFMRFPAGSVDPYEKIIKKIKKEARQLHGITEPRIILLDTSGIAEDVFRLQLEQIRDELLNLMRRTPELACVWLMMRRWSTAQRFKYWGYMPGILRVCISFLLHFSRGYSFGNGNGISWGSVSLFLMAQKRT